SAHFISSLLAVSALDNELIGTVLCLTGLVTQSGLGPGSHRAGTANRRAALTTAVGVVIGVHNGTTNGGTDTHMAGTAGLADVDVLVVQVTHLADAGSAVGAHIPHFAGGQTNLSQIGRAHV